MPQEWQSEEWIVYCDYLEHLLLHIMITENPEPLLYEFETVGSVGMGLLYMVPELMKFYAGCCVSSKRINSVYYAVIAADKDVFLELLKRLYSPYVNGVDKLYIDTYERTREVKFPIGLNSLTKRDVLEEDKDRCFTLAREIWEYTMPYDHDLWQLLDCVFDPKVSYYDEMDYRFCNPDKYIDLSENDLFPYRWSKIEQNYCKKYPGTHSDNLYRFIRNASLASSGQSAPLQLSPPDKHRSSSSTEPKR